MTSVYFYVNDSKIILFYTCLEKLYREQHVQYFKADWMLYILVFKKVFLQSVQHDETFIKCRAQCIRVSVVHLNNS